MNVALNAGVILIKDSKILLVKENEEPLKGKWNFPNGTIEQNETIEECAKRETLEETGYQVNLVSFLGVFQQVTETLTAIIFMFEAEPSSESTSAISDEVSEVKWFDTDIIQNLSDSDLVDKEMKKVVGLTDKGYPLSAIKQF